MTEKKMLLMMVLSQLMLETLDDIKGTEYDKGKFKTILKQLELYISKNFNKKLDKLFSGNSDDMLEIMKAIEVAVEELASFELEDVVYIGNALKDYKNKIKQHD